MTASLQVKGDRFYIVARVPDSTGKTHQKWISTGLPIKGNKRRAQRIFDEKVIELQAKYERRYRQAGWSVQDVADVPFVDVVDRWMARKRKTLVPSTVNGYANILARLRPYFQCLALTTGEVSPAVLEAYLEHLSNAGLSANTVAHHLTLLKSVFNDEIRAGAPLLNPARCVKPPKVEPCEAAVLCNRPLPAKDRAQRPAQAEVPRPAAHLRDPAAPRGCTLREIQAYLGHATYLTTTRYAHMDARSKERALGIMTEALNED